jgi:hypothetical protein
MRTSRVRLVAFALLYGILPGTAAHADAPGDDEVGNPPERIVLNGVVRDFLKEHEDFDVEPIDGTGHCAGNIAQTLGADGRPVFTAEGFMVETQWLNPGGRPIPPHLFRAGIGGMGILRLAEAPEVSPLATFDTWDSSVGPYGGDNVGPAPQVEVGAAMPQLTEPQGIGSSAGDVTLDMAMLTGEMHCDDLTITGRVLIGGPVTILCEGEFRLETHAEVVLQPGASLELYVKQGVKVMPHADLNANTGRPDQVVIYVLGDEEMRISQPHGVVYAAVVAPDAHMRVMPNADFYGTLIGKSLELQPNSGFHMDAATTIPIDACGNVIDDTASTSTATTASIPRTASCSATRGTTTTTTSRT